MKIDSLPNYSIRELNAAIGNLLERGFAPRFLLHASITKSAIRKGHQWLTLSDEGASITAVIWSSQLEKLNYKPSEGEAVIVVGKLNFWTSRATLSVQVLDIRPSLTTVLQKFQINRDLLMKEGLIAEERKRALPSYPSTIAILTSVPSSALADMMRTSKERWPKTNIIILPIPVQGNLAKTIVDILNNLSTQLNRLGIEAIVLARGGGSREDLMIFDDLDLCRKLAAFPRPVVTGLGHEDDLTVADLVSDYRAATPTAAIVALLPSRLVALGDLLQRRQSLFDHFHWLISNQKMLLKERVIRLADCSPLLIVKRYRSLLQQKEQILHALSVSNSLERGFAILRNDFGKLIASVDDLTEGDKLRIQLKDGDLEASTNKINYNKSDL